MEQNINLYYVNIFILLFLFSMGFFTTDKTYFKANSKNISVGAINLALSYFLLAYLYDQVTKGQGYIFSLHPLKWNDSPWLLLVCFLTADFIFYLSHYLSHRFTWLWKIHSFHHDIEILMPSVEFRHAFLSLVQGALLLCLAGVILNLSLFWLSYSYALIGLYQIYVHSAKMTAPSSLEKIIVTPQLHRVHHDQVLMNKNLGGFFCFWDHLFRTYEKPRTNLTYGIVKTDPAQ